MARMVSKPAVDEPSESAASRQSETEPHTSTRKSESDDAESMFFLLFT